jgi:hypothetical protein
MSGKTALSRPPHSVGMNLLTIAVGAALLGIGAAYLIDAVSKTARTEPHRLDQETTLNRALGGHELAIPLAWFRYEEQRVEGFAKQIDLQLELPLGAEGKAETVDVTLLPRSRVRPSSSLLDGVYLHQFADGQVTGGPVGLVGKPLKPGEGYDGEVVWYDALAADPFVAKCSKPVAVAAEGQCLRTVYLGPGLAAVYAFPETALAGWRAFDAEMGKRLRTIGAL